MRCHICNSVLLENEVKEDPRFEDFSPCGKCQQIIDEVFEPLPDNELPVDEEEEEEDENASAKVVP